jgi:hypothetical protein
MKKVKMKRNPVDPDQRSVTSGYSFSQETLKKLRCDAKTNNMSISGYMDMLIVNDIKQRAERNRQLLLEKSRRDLTSPC